jgi:hypothetical protein
MRNRTSWSRFSTGFFFKGLICCRLETCPTSSYQQIGPDELGALDADAFEGPILRSRDGMWTFFADEKGIGADGGTHAGVPGDGAMILEQFFIARG